MAKRYLITATAAITGLTLILFLVPVGRSLRAVQSDGWIFLGGPTAPGGTVDAIAVAPSAPDRLYTLVWHHAGERLFRSDDAALTWQQVYTFTAAVDALAVDPTDRATVYAGAPDGLLRSRDGGLSWTQVYTVGAAFAVASPTLLYAGGQIAGPDDVCYIGYFGVARSDDGGTTWRMTSIGCATDLTVITVHPQNPDIIYVGGSDWTERVWLLLRSTDGGVTWTSLPALPPWIEGAIAVYGLILDPRQPEHLFASDDHGLLRSTDGGDTWERLDWQRQALPSEPFRLAVDTNGTVYAVRAYAPEGTPIYRSDDGGETWWVSLAHLPRGANALVADPLHPETLYAGLSEYGVFQSSNGGGAWQERNVGIRSLVSVSTLSVAFSNPNLVYAGADKPRGGLFRSTDGGLTWMRVITDTPILAVAVNPVTPTIAYAGGLTGLHKTRDGGHTWALISTDLATYALASSPGDPSVLYAGGKLRYMGTPEQQGLVIRFRLKDGYVHEIYWAKLPALEIEALAVHPLTSTLVYAGGTDPRKYGVVFRSQDSGDTWQEVLSGVLQAVNVLVMDERRPDVIYAGTSHQGVYRSLDGGDTWERWSAGLGGSKPSRIYALAADALGIPYAGTRDGVYRWEAGQAAWVPFGLQGQPVRALAVGDGLTRMLLAGTDVGVWRRMLPLWRVWLPLVQR